MKSSDIRILTWETVAATKRLARWCWTSRNSCSWTCWRRTEHACGQLWSIKFILFSMVYRANRGHELATINPSSHVLLHLIFFNSTYFHANVHVRCTLLRQKADRMSRSRKKEANWYCLLRDRFVASDSSRFPIIS